MIQANMPRPSGVAGMADSGAARIRATIRRGGVAYITGEPAAPQLTARFKGLPPWIRVTWGGGLVSERTERESHDNRSTATVEIGGASVYAITAELQNEVVGGLFTLHAQPAGVAAVDCAYRRMMNGEVWHEIDYGRIAEWMRANVAVADPRSDAEKAAYAKESRRAKRRRFAAGGGPLRRWINEHQYRLYRHLDEVLQRKGMLPRERALWF